MKLDCHRADHDEKRAAFANVYEFWGNELPLDEYVQWRLNSIHHQRAIWYVGVVDGIVAVSLGVFPMYLSLNGDVQPTMFIGAVHTHPDYRRRGYANQLIAFAEADQAAQDGVRWSILFSDIDPNYYARMGYQISNAPNVCIRPADIGGGDVWLTEPLDVQTEFEKMIKLYETNHRQQSCYLYRCRDYWEFLIQKHAKDQFYWLTNQGERVGYFHIRHHKDLACLEDFAVADHDDATLSQLAQTLACHALQQNISEIHGWFPPISLDFATVEFRERKTEITMWKSLTGEQLTSQQAAELVYFRHVDHV